MPDRNSDLESTQTLLARVSEGDSEALENLYRRYLPCLRRYARGRLPVGARDLMDTDDLVQETLLRTLNGVKSFEPEHSGAFLSYVTRGVLNRIRDELRRRSRRPRRDGTVSALLDDGPSPVEQAIGREALNRYQDALKRLKPTEREAIIARIELGLSYREVAREIGKPTPDAARMAVKRALLSLAEEMSREVDDA